MHLCPHDGSKLKTTNSRPNKAGSLTFRKVRCMVCSWEGTTVEQEFLGNAKYHGNYLELVDSTDSLGQGMANTIADLLNYVPVNTRASKDAMAVLTAYKKRGITHEL